MEFQTKKFFAEVFISVCKVHNSVVSSTNGQSFCSRLQTDFLPFSHPTKLFNYRVFTSKLQSIKIEMATLHQLELYRYITVSMIFNQ